MNNGDFNFKLKLNEELSKLDTNAIILLEVKSEYCFDSVLELIKFLTEKGMSGVYLSVTRPYRYIIKKFDENNIKKQKLFFVDTISCMAGKSPGEFGECIFLESPSAIQDIEIAIENSMGKIKDENKFLIIDSLSTMLIYNDAKTLEKLIEMLVRRLRTNKSGGIFVSIEGEITDNFREKLKELCDKTIKV